jgi:hypothetical protein
MDDGEQQINVGFKRDEEKMCKMLIIWLSLISTLEEASIVWFWHPKLNEENLHEGKSKCRKDPHRWIVLVVPFSMICGEPRSSSLLGRYDFVKLQAPKKWSRSP